jgi:hypothetical protein
MSDRTSFVFPHQEFTAILGEPTNATITKLKKQCFANLLSVRSDNGGGAHGHLGLGMTAAKYAAYSNIPFIVPPHPGALPNIPAGATAAARDDIKTAHAAILAQVRVANEVQGEIKKLLLAAIDPTYLEPLEDELVGFAQTTPLAILEHLEEHYAKISRQDRERNRAALSSPFDIDSPIQSLFARINEQQRFAAAANEPIADDTAIDLTVTMLEAGGGYGRACESWREKPPADWTKLNFIEHFTKAAKERERQRTTKQTGYHGEVVAAVKDNKSNTKPDEKARTDGGTIMYYCWSHGAGTNPDHTSKSCERQLDGHKVNATIKNTMGGCEKLYKRAPRRPKEDATASAAAAASKE